MRTRILYIEDEAHLAKIVTDTLILQGYDVLHKIDGTQVIEVVQEFEPNICLFDVMLPHIDGFSLGSAIRNLFPNLPIIFITAKSQTQDVLKGFSSGGTDYIRKPFSMEELMVRIDNQMQLIRNNTKETTTVKDVRLGNIIFLPSKMELHFADERKTKLSHRETAILNVLCLHKNQIVDRRRLLQLVWGDDSFFNSRNLDVYINKLRGYLGDNSGVEIITLKGVGYQFVVA